MLKIIKPTDDNVKVQPLRLLDFTQQCKDEAYRQSRKQWRLLNPNKEYNQ